VVCDRTEVSLSHSEYMSVICLFVPLCVNASAHVMILSSVAWPTSFPTNDVHGHSSYASRPVHRISVHGLHNTNEKNLMVYISIRHSRWICTMKLKYTCSYVLTESGRYPLSDRRCCQVKHKLQPLQEVGCSTRNLVPDLFPILDNTQTLQKLLIAIPY
jgi:hypothetical protein